MISSGRLVNLETFMLQRCAGCNSTKPFSISFNYSYITLYLSRICLKQWALSLCRCSYFSFVFDLNIMFHTQLCHCIPIPDMVMSLTPISESFI